MTVSAAWHGVRPGYFLSLGAFPFVIAVERAWQEGVTERVGDGKVRKLLKVATATGMNWPT